MMPATRRALDFGRIVDVCWLFFTCSSPASASSLPYPGQRTTWILADGLRVVTTMLSPLLDTSIVYRRVSNDDQNDEEKE